MNRFQSYIYKTITVRLLSQAGNPVIQCWTHTYIDQTYPLILLLPIHLTCTVSSLRITPSRWIPSSLTLLISINNRWLGSKYLSSFASSGIKSNSSSCSPPLARHVTVDLATWGLVLRIPPLSLRLSRPHTLRSVKHADDELRVQHPPHCAQRPGSAWRTTRWTTCRLLVAL